MSGNTRYSKFDAPSFRPVRYDGPNKKLDASIGVDILTLYITCGLGYSPIRHILGLTNDKIIEDVVRQHRLGRSLSHKPGYAEECRLRCPKSDKLDEISTAIIRRMVVKYNTEDDDYNYTMLVTGRWVDDPVVMIRCKKCGSPISSGYQICTKCGEKIRPKKPRPKIFDIVQ